MEYQECLGILINDAEWRRIQNGKSYESITHYEDAAEKCDVQLCYFRIEDINLKQSLVKGFFYEQGSWIQKVIPLPTVIHNRAIFSKRRAYRRLVAIKNKGVSIFNFWNRYGKLTIHRLFERKKVLRPYLPFTLPFNKPNTRHFLHHYPAFFLKPDKGTIGEGIIKLQRISEQQWKIVQQRKQELRFIELQEEQLYPYLMKWIGQKKYILQEEIDLLKYNGSPLDIRVSVQKDGKGEWQLTGMVGKVAMQGAYLSNVAQGGSVVEWKHVFDQHPDLDEEKIKHRAQELAIYMVSYLDQTLPNLADVGFDFGLNQQGHPFFIEMNSRDQRYSFHLAGLHETFKRTYENPIAYGCLVLRERK